MLLGIAVLCLPFASLAQSVPPKGANAIIIQTTDSGRVALRQFASILVQRGYVIDKLDAGLGSLITKPRTLPVPWNPVVVLQASFSQNSLVVRSQYSLQTAAGVGNYSGCEKCVDKTVFNEGVVASKLYPGGVITYQKQ